MVPDLGFETWKRNFPGEEETMWWDKNQGIPVLSYD